MTDSVRRSTTWRIRTRAGLIRQVNSTGSPCMYEKEIVYDPETRNIAMYLDGELKPVRRTYPARGYLIW